MLFFYAGFWAEIEPVSKKKEDEDLLEDCDFYTDLVPHKGTIVY